MALIYVACRDTALISLYPSVALMLYNTLFLKKTGILIIQVVFNGAFWGHCASLIPIITKDISVIVVVMVVGGLVAQGPS